MKKEVYQVTVWENDFGYGGEEWRQNGKLHRTDGKPAVTHPTGKIWYKEGKFHREDGPAYIYDESEFYYLNDKLVTKEEVEPKNESTERA